MVTIDQSRFIKAMIPSINQAKIKNIIRYGRAVSIANDMKLTIGTRIAKIRESLPTNDFGKK